MKNNFWKLRSITGFTLIEILIVMVIVGILVAVSYPSYTDYITRARRSSALTALHVAAQFLERNYTVNNCYRYTSTLDCSNASGTNIVLPQEMQRAPSEGAPYYTISVSFSDPAGSDFKLSAIPVTTSSQSNDLCGTLTYANTGVKGAEKFGVALSDALTAKCWSGG